MVGSGKYTGTIYYNSCDDPVRTGYGVMVYTTKPKAKADSRSLEYMTFRGEQVECKYQGLWKDNMWHGEGTLYLPFFSIFPMKDQGSSSMAQFDLTERCIYVGEFDQGYMQGEGRLTLPNGNEWKGMWNKSLRANATPSMMFYPGGERHVPKWVGGYWNADWDDFMTVSKYALLQSEKYKALPPPIEPMTKLILVQLPSYPDTVVPPNIGGIVLRGIDKREPSFEALRQFFHATNPEWLGRGDPGRTFDPSNEFNAITPIAAFDIDYSRSDILHKYLAALGSYKVEKTVERCKASASTTTCTRTSKFLEKFQNDPNEPGLFTSNDTPLNAEYNEKLLLHSGPWRAIWAILQQGFDETKSKRGLFGKGCYFAEDPGKCNQYARYITAENLEVLKPWLGITDYMMAKSIVYDNKTHLFAMLMCRVVLGCSANVQGVDFRANASNVPKQTGGGTEPLFFRDRDPTTHKVPNGAPTDMSEASNLNWIFNSITVNTGGGIGGVQRYREFIVYKGIVARPSQLILFTRNKVDLPPNYQWPGDPFQC